MAVMLKEVIQKETLLENEINVTMSKKRKRGRQPYNSRNFNYDSLHGNLSFPKRKPYKEYKDFDDDDDYEIDFYEDKNYEYIDQDHVESLINYNIVNNHKMGLAFAESEKGNKFYFSPLDYNNYDYEEVGNLNFRGDWWFHHEPDSRRKYRRGKYYPKNKIFFSKRKLRKCF